MSAETVFELRAEIDQLRDAINRQDREVERLQAELDRRVDAAAEALADQTMMRGLTVKDGAINLDLIPPREIAMQWVNCARGMLGDAENYTETRVEFPQVSMEVSPAGSFDSYALIVQRVGKLTPHEARRQAEAERDAFRDALIRLQSVVEDGPAEHVAIVMRDTVTIMREHGLLEESVMADSPTREVSGRA